MKLVRFITVFVVLYGGLLIPWPGWQESYGRWFRAFAGAVFSQETGSIVRFRRAEKPPRPVIDTEIVLARSTNPDADSHVRASISGLDTRSVGLVPTAWLVGLVLATPVPWRRRLTTLVAGLIAVHGYLLVVVAAYLWNESGGIVPFGGGPFSATIGDFLEETLVTQLGPSFVIPVLIWLALFVWTGPANLVQWLTPGPDCPVRSAQQLP